MSGDDDLFGGLPKSEAVAAKPFGAPRLREPVRDQVGLRVVDLDALIGPNHAARIIWASANSPDRKDRRRGTRPCRELKPEAATRSNGIFC